MALYTEYAGDKRGHEPLGGREADGFGQWLETTELQMREQRESLINSLSLDNPLRYVAREAAAHYGSVLHAWGHVVRGSDPRARHEFEVRLISEVMRAYSAAEFARQCGYGPKDVTSGGRPLQDITTEYLRTCIILGKYAGVGELTVTACQGDQDALTALRNAQD